ncbi:MAG: GNAT family N-acetyltransferase [Acinetobacter sp.]|jgi:putative hemolysin|nr:MAG: GNAT family N-acetyltransferase [Acinetobacter sp.]
MLAKLNQYRQHLSLPLTKSKTSASPLRFEWVDDLKQLQQVQHFRARQFSEQFGVSFEQGLDQDVYDFGCEHAVIREKWSGEIVAYTRLKLLQGYELAHSYSAKEFDVVPHFAQMSNIVEVGRTCVHPQFRSGKALSMLWLNLAPKVLWGMRAKCLMGCVSVRLEDNLARAYYTHQHLQRLSPEQSIDIASLQTFEPVRPTHSFVQDERMPKLFDAYLNMQAKLSKQAYYDKDFNCLDYFVFLEVNQVAKSFVMNKMIQK